MPSYRVTEAAQSDIEEIILTVADENPEAAEMLEDRIYEAFDLLAEMPGIGHSREDLTSLPVLFWPIKKTSYAAIYRNASAVGSSGSCTGGETSSRSCKAKAAFSGGG